MNSSSTRLTLLAVAGMLALVTMMLQAATGPSWWVTRGTINTNAIPNDFAAVNQGQLKWMAVNAAMELESQLPGGAGSNVWTLIESFSGTNNFRPVNLGQLKYVAQPFYDRLIEVGYTTNYPWSGSTNQVNDFVLANIGQMKNVFSFDVKDSDSDGIPDWWEIAHGLNPNNPNDADQVSTHPWAHGLTNRQVFWHPSVLLADGYSTLEDNVPNWWKIIRNYDETTPASTVGANGLTLLQNYQNGCNPNLLPVIPESMTVTGWYVQAELSKCGFNEFTNTPKKVYLRMVENGVYDISMDEDPPVTNSYTGIHHPTPTNCVLEETGSPYGCYYTEITITQLTQIVGSNTNEWYPDQFTKTLSDEYTTSLLTNLTAQALGIVANDPNQWLALDEYTIPEAIRNVSEDERTCSLQKLRYQISFLTTSQQLYKVTWLERFISQDGAITSLTQRIQFVPSTGTNAVTSQIQLEPPGTNGTITVLPVSTEFRISPSNINYGWDPMGDAPWTSVGVGSTNQIVMLGIGGSISPDDVHLVITEGADKVNVSPTNGFTVGDNALTIIGSNAGSATVEARIQPVGTVLSKLNIMVLSNRTLSVGIYRVEDWASTNTCPVGGPPDSQIVSNLNDIYRQTCIQFVLTNSFTTNIVYDGVFSPYQADGRADKDEANNSIACLGLLNGQVRVFLFRNSGYPYDATNQNVFVRGWTLNYSYSVVYTTNMVTNTVPHEVGHQLLLPVRDWGVGHHDPDPVPPGTEHLMKSGAPVGQWWPVPTGRWLRKDDWEKANNTAKVKSQ